MNLDSALLGEDLLARAGEELDVGFALPVHPEVGTLAVGSVGELVRGVGAHDHDARLVAEQARGIADQRDHVRRPGCALHVEQVALRVHQGGQAAVLVYPRAQNRVGGDGDRRAGVERGGLAGIGAIQRVVDAGAALGAQADAEALAAGEQAAGHGVLCILGAALVVHVSVGSQGRGRRQIAALAAVAAPVGDAADLNRNVEGVEDLAAGRGEAQAVTAAGGEGEGRAQVAALLRRIAARAEDHQILLRPQGGPRGELPFAGVAQVVGEAAVAQIDALAAGVVDLDPVGAAVQRCGHDLIDAHGDAAETVDLRLDSRACAVFQVRRGRQRGRPAAIFQGTGLALLQQGKIHRGDRCAVGLGEEHALAAPGESEVGVQVVGILRAVVSGAVQRQIAAGRQGHIRQLPLLQPHCAVGEPVALQIDVRIRRVVQFDVVAAFAVLIGEVDAVGAHGLADFHCAAVNFHLDGFAGRSSVVLRTGRGDEADLPFAVDAAVGAVIVHLRRFDAVQQIAVHGDQKQRAAAGCVQLEGCV